LHIIQSSVCTHHNLEVLALMPFPSRYRGRPCWYVTSCG